MARSLPAHVPALPLAGFLGVALSACAGTSRPAVPPGGGPGLEFPDVPKGHLVESSVIMHEVKLFFEMDRAPGKEEEPAVEKEVEKLGGAYRVRYPGEPPRHRFQLDEGHFTVGGFRYPARRNAILLIFGERPGEFAFSAWGRSFVVERAGRWKPAVLYTPVEETQVLDEGREQALPPARTGSRSKRSTRRTVTRLVREEIQVGPHRIETAPGAPLLEIDGRRVAAPPGAVVSVGRLGEVRVTE